MNSVASNRFTQTLGEDRPLRAPGGAAGVLQERNIVRTEARFLEHPLPAAGERLAEAGRAGNAPGRDHALMPARNAPKSATG